MRINLRDQERTRRLRRQTRQRRQRRPSQLYEIAVARPEAPPRTTRPKSAARAKPAEPRRPAARVKSRRPARTAAAPAVRRVNWPLVLLKLAALGGLMGVAALVWHASTSVKFYVYQAEIVGNQRLGSDAIYQVAGIDEMSIFWVRPEKVEAAIGQMNGVRSVRVQCGLPARVRIEVVEREPVVMWRVLSQGRDWWLDEDGVVLPYHGDLDHTIFVVDSSVRELHEGDRLEPDGLVTSVQQLAAAVPNVKVFFYQPDRGLSFTQQGPNGDQEWPVYVGTSQDLPRKIAILRALSSYLAEHNIRPQHIDVRWADHPVFGAPPGQPGEQATQQGN